MTKDDAFKAARRAAEVLATIGPEKLDNYEHTVYGALGVQTSYARFQLGGNKTIRVYFDEELKTDAGSATADPSATPSGAV